MEFMATLKRFSVSGKGATVNFDVPIDDVGDLEGIQKFVGDWVRVSVTPYQLSINDIQVVNDGN